MTGVLQSAQKNSLAYLDLLRGVSAFLVLIGHARAFCMESFASGAGAPNIFVQGFYFITGFGHQSVMVFFVISGFLIGRHVMDSVAGGKWSWPNYLIDRVSRLWLVLIPCLILTAIFDYFGMLQDGLGFYQGNFQSTLLVGASPPGIDSGLLTAVLNALFLQKVTAPVYGSNGPLWSLSYEFWYYLLFPIALLTVVSTRAWKLAYLLIFAAICLLMPKDILLYGLVWLFGALSAYGSQRLVFSKNQNLLLLCISLIFLAGCLVYSRMPQHDGVLMDMAVGMACALVVWAVATKNWAVWKIFSPAIWLSKMSYSLYLAHMPLLALIWVAALRYERQPFGLSSMINMSIMVISAIILAWCIYFLFEKNTNQVRYWLKAKILGLKPNESFA